MNLKRSIIYLAFICSLFVLGSCDDRYEYNDGKIPEWLGSSIYDYLKERDEFSIYAKLIEDVGYVDILGKTGSKTLFVASDSAFAEFFKDGNNPWGVNSYDEMSLSQKKMILKYGMINNAYLIETLSNYNDGGLVEGSAMRRLTAYSYMDSIPKLKEAEIPESSYWTKYKSKGLYLVQDDSDYPLVHFLPSQIAKDGISQNDFNIITGISRENDDAHIFNIKVIKRDITCQNGYIHVLEDVLIPRTNMADYVQNNEETSEFASLLDRFCAPYYSASITTNYKLVHNDFDDSIFVKRFFNPNIQTYPDGKIITNSSLLLNYDPGWNEYRPTGTGLTLQNDMGAMLAPSDEAMTKYWTEGAGVLLKNKYTEWDNLPLDIAALFVNRHLRNSFLSSIPSTFPKMTDTENSDIDISEDNIVGTYLGVNGLVYITNKVFPPDDYRSVYAPVLFGESTEIFNWIIRRNEYRLYLNAMVSDTTYSFFVPTDSYFDNYIDPFSLAMGKDKPGVLKFRYDSKEDEVYASVWEYDPQTGVVGDSVAYIEDQDFVNNRLLDILENHIVVDDVTNGKEYYMTKGGCHIKVDGSGESLKVQGGGDIIAGTICSVTDYFDQENGKTYFTDKLIQTPLRSTYSVLSSDTARYGEFLNLCLGFSANDPYEVFVRRASYYGLDYSVKFFNTFHYTVWVPTNEAIRQAIKDGIIVPWESRYGITGINDMASIDDQKAAIKKLGRFIRAHFQDNSVLIDGEAKNETYTTATLKTDDVLTYLGTTYKNKYYQIEVTSNGDEIYLLCDFNLSDMDGNGKINALDRELTTPNKVRVLTANEGQYNNIVRDYIFSANPSSVKEIDGSGSGSDYYTSEIYTSSTAVINQIDGILTFE